MGVTRVAGVDRAAVLAALVALAHRRGASIPPEPHQRALAEVEGWIAIPTVSLDQLGAVA